MFNNPFREDAAANRNQRQQLDHLLRVTAPHERIILAGIGAVLLALAAWCLFGRIDQSITTDCLLIEPGARHEVVSSQRGHLVEFLVNPGDRVKAGDRIARQSVPELERETETLRARVDLLEKEIRPVGGAASLLATARVALLQMEARQAAAEWIVSPVDGKIIALRPQPGEYISAGAAVAQIRESESGPLTAVLRVPEQVAQRIQPLMPAAVYVDLPDSEVQSLDGEVALVIGGPLPHWLAEQAPAVINSMSRVDVVLRQTPDLSFPDGAPCRARVILGSQAPAELFGLGRS